MPVKGSMVEFWMKWATHVAFALHVGILEMVRELIGLAIAIALATLHALGIQYGVRHTA